MWLQVPEGCRVAWRFDWLVEGSRWLLIIGGGGDEERRGREGKREVERKGEVNQQVCMSACSHIHNQQSILRQEKKERRVISRKIENLEAKNRPWYHLKSCSQRRSPVMSCRRFLSLLRPFQARKWLLLQLQMTLHSAGFQQNHVVIFSASSCKGFTPEMFSSSGGKREHFCSL